MPSTTTRSSYEQFNGVVLAEEEGHNIARTLGNKKAAFLRYVSHSHVSGRRGLSVSGRWVKLS